RPASPKSTPDSTMTRAVLRDTFMPAVRAALGLAPTARSEKPNVDRVSNHQQPTAAAIAISRPALTGNDEPSRCGNRAVPWIVRDTACPEPDFWKPLVVSK